MIVINTDTHTHSDLWPLSMKWMRKKNVWNEKKWWLHQLIIIITFIIKLNINNFSIEKNEYFFLFLLQKKNTSTNLPWKNDYPWRLFSRFLIDICFLSNRKSPSFSISLSFCIWTLIEVLCNYNFVCFFFVFHYSFLTYIIHHYFQKERKKKKKTFSSIELTFGFFLFFFRCCTYNLTSSVQKRNDDWNLFSFLNP